MLFGVVAVLTTLLNSTNDKDYDLLIWWFFIMIGIYKITNPKNRVYIGQSIDIEKRFSFYKRLSCKGQKKLYNSFLKYKIENHKFQVLCECNIDELNDKERYYQELHNVLSKNGLNCVYQCTKEKRKVISEVMKNKISFANKGVKNGMYGVKHTEEFKKQRRNYRHTKENIEKISQRSKGGNNPNAKIVIDLSTGIFYDCVSDAAFVLGMSRSMLTDRLIGTTKNKTSYIYA